jgi:hypothetical protein
MERKHPVRELLVFCAAGLLLETGAPCRAEPVPEAPGEIRAAPLPGGAWRVLRLGPDTYRELFTLSAPGRELTLSWRGLPWGSERVSLDGRRLRPGIEYTLDCSQGILRVSTAPPPGSVLEIVYRTAPYLSEPASPGDTRAPGLQPPYRRPRFGVRAAASRETSPSIVERGPGLPPLTAAGYPAPGGGDRLRDELLSGLRETALQEQITGVGAASARVSYFRADPLDPRTVPDAREEFNSQLNLRPTPQSRLSLSNFVSRDSLFSEDYEEQERHRLKFDQTWNRSTASLMWERRRSDGYGLANSLDALSLSLTHPFTRNLAADALFEYENSLHRGSETRSLLSLRQLLGDYLEAQANLQYRTTEFTGSSLDTGLSLFARPGASADATLTLRQSQSGQYGRYQRVGAEVNASVSRQVQVTGEVSQRLTERFGNVQTFGLGLAARPAAATLLEAAFSESTGGRTGRERSHTVRLHVDPSAAVRLQLGYDLLNSDLGDASRNALWLVTLGGRRYVKLEGYAGSHEVSDDGVYDDALYRVELRPLDPLALSGSLRRVQNDAEARALAGVGATLKLIDGVDVAAGYRRPTALEEGDPDEVGRDLKLSLSPAPRLRLFGQYSERPEDARGMLLDQVHRSLGMETRLGSFSLVGSLTRMEGAFAPDPGRRLDVLASLSLGEGTRIYGGLRTGNPTTLEPLKSRLYRFGISQTAGSSLFLMLEGQFGWLMDAEGNRTWDSEDTRAQARVGLRF